MFKLDLKSKLAKYSYIKTIVKIFITLIQDTDV